MDILYLNLTINLGIGIITIFSEWPKGLNKDHDGITDRYIFKTVFM